jgi:hypothetical protein
MILTKEIPDDNPDYNPDDCLCDNLYDRSHKKIDGNPKTVQTAF